MSRIPERPTRRPRLRFDGWIAGIGTSSGTRIVLGHWERSPFGPFSDVMLERPNGERLLLAPSPEPAAFIAGAYTFDRVRVVPVGVQVAGDDWTVAAGSLELRFTTGRRGPLGLLLRAVPGALARRPGWSALTDLPARLLLPGVRTRGSSRAGRREWYGARDLRPVTAATAVFEGDGLGPIAPVEPPVRFGYGSVPSKPAVARITTTVDLGTHRQDGTMDVVGGAGAGALGWLRRSQSPEAAMSVPARDSHGGRAHHRILGIYLNDHVAGATAGVELARRMVQEHRDTPFGDDLENLAQEISLDRQALMRIMTTLDVPVRRYKVYGAWVGEKAGRLKPNGRLRRRSGLTVVVELEAMRLGVQGKALLWRSLLGRAARDPRLDAGRLQELLTRAEQQIDVLDSLHARAGSALLSPGGPMEREAETVP